MIFVRSVDEKRFSQNKVFSEAQFAVGWSWQLNRAEVVPQSGHKSGMHSSILVW